MNRSSGQSNSDSPAASVPQPDLSSYAKQAENEWLVGYLERAAAAAEAMFDSYAAYCEINEAYASAKKYKKNTKLLFGMLAAVLLSIINFSSAGYFFYRELDLNQLHVTYGKFCFLPEMMLLVCSLFLCLVWAKRVYGEMLRFLLQALPFVVICAAAFFQQWFYPESFVLNYNKAIDNMWVPFAGYMLLICFITVVIVKTTRNKKFNPLAVAIGFIAEFVLLSGYTYYTFGTDVENRFGPAVFAFAALNAVGFCAFLHALVQSEKWVSASWCILCISPNLVLFWLFRVQNQYAWMAVVFAASAAEAFIVNAWIRKKLHLNRNDELKQYVDQIAAQWELLSLLPPDRRSPIAISIILNHAKKGTACSIGECNPAYFAKSVNQNKNPEWISQWKTLQSIRALLETDGQLQ